MEKKRERKGFNWRIWLALGFIVALAAIFGKPLYLLMHAWMRDKPVVENLPAGYIDDASRMNRTHVAEVRPIPADPGAAESQLRDLIKLARSKRLHVAIAGARHSMRPPDRHPESRPLCRDPGPAGRVFFDLRRPAARLDESADRRGYDRCQRMIRAGPSHLLKICG